MTRFYENFSIELLNEVRQEYHEKIKEITAELKWRKNNKTREKYKITCDVCNATMDKYNWGYHVSSNKHLKNVKAKESEKV
jgi:hypothetical protein